MRDEILNYIIDNTKKEVFEIALKNHNLHSLYKLKKNHIIYKYFGGNVLRFSVYMCELFNEYITEGQQIEAAQLDYYIRQLDNNIRRAKKYKSPYLHWIEERNEKVTRYNEIMKGANRLVRLWNKRHKLKQAA
jgi:hypothetical protein